MNDPKPTRLVSALTVFSLAFPIVYVVLYYHELALFRFYPLVGELHLNIQPTTLGPAMIYYGWIIISALVSSLVAVAVPHRWVVQMWPGWSWVVPLAATLFTFAYETRWLFH